MEITAYPEPRTIALIPCGAGKLDTAAPARDLYTSSTFRMALRAAQDNADEVYVVSAKHGLLDLDAVVDPYEVKMGDAGCVTVETLAAQFAALVGEDERVAVYAFLPRTYLVPVDEALRTHDVYAQDVYEDTRGIGDHRRIANLAAA